MDFHYFIIYGLVPIMAFVLFFLLVGAFVMLLIRPVTRATSTYVPGEVGRRFIRRS